MKIIRYFMIGVILLSHPGYALASTSQGGGPGGQGAQIITAADPTKVSTKTYQHIQILINQGDVCGAAKEFNGLKRDRRDPQFGPMIDQLLQHIGALPEDRLMACDQFASLLKSTPLPEDAPSLLFWRGKELYDRKDFAEAGQLFERELSTYPKDKYAAWARFYEAECERLLHHFDDAIKHYQVLLSSYPYHSLVQDALFEVTECWFAKGDLKWAANQYSVFHHSYPDDPRNRSLCEKLMQALKAEYPAPKSAEITEPLQNCAPEDPIASKQLFERGDMAFKAKDYQGAQKYFQRIMLVYPISPYAAEAYFHNAQCYFMRGEMKQAADAYKSYYQNYPNDSHVGQAKQQEAFASGQLGTVPNDGF